MINMAFMPLYMWEMWDKYKRNIFSVLKDILAYPSRTVLHNFPITSSNVSDNIETKWSDQYSMQNLPYFEAKSLWQLLFGQKVKQSLPICRNVFILNNQKILCCKVSRVTIVSLVFFSLQWGLSYFPSFERSRQLIRHCWLLLNPPPPDMLSRTEVSQQMSLKNLLRLGQIFPCMKKTKGLQGNVGVVWKSKNVFTITSKNSDSEEKKFSLWSCVLSESGRWAQS